MTTLAKIYWSILAVPIFSAVLFLLVVEFDSPLLEPHPNLIRWCVFANACLVGIFWSLKLLDDLLTGDIFLGSPSFNFKKINDPVGYWITILFEAALLVLGYWFLLFYILDRLIKNLPIVDAGGNFL